jgi:hypothetical protein
MLRLIEERIGSSSIQVEHRDGLIRLRAMIEDDLTESNRYPTERSHDRPRSEPE